MLLTKVGDQIVWDLPFFCIGYTAFTNLAPVITGTNVTFGTRWGNHDIEYQVDSGSGYSGIWLNLTAANLIAQTINSTPGFRIRIRATCAIASALNALTNLRVNMTSTAASQEALYPLTVNTVTFTGLPVGCDVVVLTAGTATILNQRDALPGTSFSFVYQGTPTIDIGFINPGFVPLYIRSLALGATDFSLPVAMTADRNYF